MDSMMSIGEFARSVGLSVSAVRFYADRGILLPASIEATTGYRSYRVGQLEQGRLIRDLRRIEMPLAEIERGLMMSARDRRGLVDRHVARLDGRLQRARQIAATLGTDEVAVQSGSDVLEVHTADFIEGLRQVAPFVGTDLEAPDLMSVLIDCKDGSLRLVATDRHRLAIRDLVPLSSGGDFGVVAASATLERWAHELASSDKVSIAVNDGYLTAEGSGVSLSARALPTAFPDYENILASSKVLTTLVVTRRQILGALETFIDVDTVVLRAATTNQISLRHGETSIQIEGTSQGADVSVGLDPVYTSECIRNAIGEDVVIEIDEPRLPVLFRSADDGTYTTLLMPVRLE